MDSDHNTAEAGKRLTGRNRLPHRFKPGQSGNPHGRPRGLQNKATLDAKEYAGQLVDSPEYRASLNLRLLAGTAGAIESLLWHYAKGKPVDRVESGGPGAFADVSTEELRKRLAEALNKL